MSRTKHWLRFLPGILLCWGLAIPPLQADDDVLRRGLGPEPDSLDIHQAQGLAALQVLRDLHEGLVTFDAGGELIGGAAERWEVDGSGTRYRFTLRPGLRWSNGDALEADHFVLGWRAAVAPATQARTASLLAPVAGARAIIAGRQDPDSLGIHALDGRTLEIVLEQPTPWFPELLAHPVSFALHPRAGEEVLERPVSGPYRLLEAVPRSHLALEKNPAWHGAASVALDRIDYLPIEDPGAELSRFRAGEIHITETIPPGRHDWLAENLPESLRIAPYVGSFWLGLNLSRPPLAEAPDLRRALSLAIDRETLTRVVMGAGEVPAWTVVPPGLPGYRPPRDPAESLSKPEREARARELYARAGYGDGRPLRLQLRFNTSAQHRRMAVAVAAMWKQVLGVSTELLHEEWKVFVNNRRQGLLTQAFRGGWIADYADPVSFLDLFRGGEALNNTFYADEAYDRLLDQAAGYSGGQRLELLQQAETLLLRDTPVIPLYYYVSRHLVDPRVRGYVDNPRDVHLSRYLDLGEP
ncbi:MAG: peptide ABC transporter substrate-binding protein [Xanthomonadales bacterium]|nr:peptide ABC transporter substrate-binding protein [Xanthomonadales bacterium]